MTGPGDDDDRRARLRALKLVSLVRDHLGRDVDADPAPFRPGAALLDGGVAWVLLEDAPARGLGPALAWSLRRDAARLNVIAERDTGLLTRRAAAFAVPIDVWHAAGRVLLPGLAEPLPPPAAPSPAHVELVETIAAGGAEPVVEHGVVLGEVRGLEVCRVVDDPLTGAVRLEVGVGAHDREAFTLIHGDVPTLEALRGVVDAVAAHRRPGAPQHPLNRLAAERLLRWSLVQDPSALGLVALSPVEGPIPRPNVKDAAPCSALGRRADGETVLVVCSVGVDLDVVPYATDARLAVSGGSDGEPGAGPGGTGVSGTVVAVPPRDAVGVTVELAASLRQPLSVVSVPPAA